MSRIRTELAASAVSVARHRTDSWYQGFRLPESFVGFEGHFPGNPVVPAVVQILMGLQLAEAVTGKSLQIIQVARAKFLQPLRPLEDIHVWYAQGGPDGLGCEIKIASDAGVAAMFRLKLAEVESLAQRKAG